MIINKSASRQVVIGILTVPSLCSGLQAQVDTPGSRTGQIIEPYQFDLGSEVGDACQTALDEQDYAWTRISTTEVGTDPPTVTVIGYLARLQIGTGIFLVDSHGNTRRHAIEVYEFSDLGMMARNQAYDQYVIDGYGAYIEKGSVHNEGHHISVNFDGIAEYFRSSDSLVFNSSCEGNAYSNSWTGARLILDYADCPGIAQGGADSRYFWERMDGKHGIGNRIATSARPAAMSLTGDGSTVLSPIVVARAPLVGGLVSFDCRMDLTAPPSAVVTADGAILSNLRWTSETSLQFDADFTSNTATFTVHASQAKSANNLAKLDGNKCGAGSNGEGPNRDDFCWTAQSPNVPALSGSGLVVLAAILLAAGAIALRIT